MIPSPRNPFRVWRARWRELLRDPSSPRRTAAGFGIGTVVGLTPILGLHTGISLGFATLFRLPPLAVVLASNVSNPFTVIPITLLEVRIGTWLLGREFQALPSSFSLVDIAPYVLEAWLGWGVLGLASGLLAYLALLGFLLRRR